MPTKSVPKKWMSYEEVATYLLDEVAHHFGLGRVEKKKMVAGRSGTDWELDATGWSKDGTKFFAIECKRHTKTGISQAITGSLAWAIRDTGAAGGILVSPLGLQSGAKKVAKDAGIVEVVLRPDSTTTEYLLQFLNRIHVGLVDTVTASVGESITIILKDVDGNVVDTRNLNG